MTDVLSTAKCDLYLLIDEWSSIPQEIQPYVAELLKHGLLPNSRITLKIASLEYRSRFGVRANGSYFGFELGSDISANLDIDDYYVYDRNPTVILEKSADILFRHLRSESDESELNCQYGIRDGMSLVDQLFTTKNVFREMVRASEGVARDLINIFSSAYFDANRQGHGRIQKGSVLSSARQWFEKDKAQNLDPELNDVLRKIIDEVIGHRKARSFLVQRDLEKHVVIQRLFDSRVLHLVVRGYADKDNPGKRYNIYTLDYGTYVDLINTSKEPQLEFEEFDSVPEDFVVPFDDKRSIRRIVVDESILDST